MVEEKNIKKASFFQRLVAGTLSREFWIPRSFIDVLFILICFALAWYAVTYDIPTAKAPVICATYWNKWAAENQARLGGLNATPMVTKWFGERYLNNS